MFLLFLLLGLPAFGPAHGPGAAVGEPDRAVMARPSAAADTIHVRGRISPAPTIDGNITVDEWSASVGYDISDTAGRGGQRQPAGSCLAYFLYDSVFAYFAVDFPSRTVRLNGDQFGPYMDENHSGTWSRDSSEGNYWVEYMNSTDEVLYRALLDTVPNVWLMGVATGASSASSLTSGHLQFEARIPIGTAKWQYSISPGDTAGFFQYAAFIGTDTTYVGWWPQTLDSLHWWYPKYYGAMVFDSLVPGVEDRRRTPTFALYHVSPSVVRDRTTICYYVGRRADVKLALYDAAGALVKTLVNGSVMPGERTVAWDRTGSAGRRVAAGMYFCRLVADGAAVSAKAIVLQ